MTAKKDVSKIKQALELAQKADAVAVQEAALKDAYQHGWDDCAASVADSTTAVQSWWDRLWA